MTELTITRKDRDTGTWWAVHDTDRATSLNIERSTSAHVEYMRSIAPTTARFTDVKTGTVLVAVHAHQGCDDGIEDSEECVYLGRCRPDTYVSSVAHELFQNAAAGDFTDQYVYQLLIDLHMEDAR